jgi:hypothetical protein
MDTFYTPCVSEVTAFGENWCGPDQYEPWKDVLVARYESSYESDGQPVEVWGCAAPARFYRIKALQGRNSVGALLGPWELGTGSGMAEQAAMIAKAISEGMLVLKPANKN